MKDDLWLFNNLWFMDINCSNREAQTQLIISSSALRKMDKNYRFMTSVPWHLYYKINRLHTCLSSLTKFKFYLKNVFKQKIAKISFLFRVMYAFQMIIIKSVLSEKFSLIAHLWFKLIISASYLKGDLLILTKIHKRK